MEHELERYFRKALNQYRNMPDWEDAVQEALIYAWQNEKKYTEPKQLRTYAAYRGKSICTNQTGAAGGATMTGHVERRSTTGTAKKQGELTREKIRVFMNEFQDLHGKKPSNKEISLGTGLPLYSVGVHLKRMTTCGMSVPPQDVKLQALFVSDHEDDRSDTSIAIERSAMEWESEEVDRIFVGRLMASLTDKQRQAVYGTYWLGMTTREVAKFMGISQGVARGHLTAALNNLKKAYEQIT